MTVPGLQLRFPSAPWCLQITRHMAVLLGFCPGPLVGSSGSMDMKAKAEVMDL